MRKKVGFIGWRGMVGSVLMSRMEKKKDFANIEPIFFSTSEIGKLISLKNSKLFYKLKNAYDINALSEVDILVSCQGSKYTKKIYFELRKKKWQGYWIDAASFLRMKKEAVIVLDPINRKEIYIAIEKGYKTFVGSNCTVSLMLMALGGLFKRNLIDWMAISTYQAASGAGSSHVLELLKQMGKIYDSVKSLFDDSSSSVLKIDKKVTNVMRSDGFPFINFGVPLAGSLIPWIDKDSINGNTKEELKVQQETNKILCFSENKKKRVSIDSTCVRIGAFRCHSQSFFIKLKKVISEETISDFIASHNSWVKLVPNNKEDTMNFLTPIAVTGTLDIPVGRIKQLSIGKKYFSIFSVGDQLLWGAAEPIRRMLKILIEI